MAGKGPVLTPIKPLGKSQQLATKGEAAVQVGLSDQQAAKSLAGLKQKVAQFSRGDKKAFRKVYRQELAKAYDANRKIGKGALSVQQHEKAYYTAYQNIFQAQQDALRAAAQEELAAYMLSGAPQTPGRVIRHIPWRLRASADISAAWNAVKSSLPWFASKDGAVASLSALAIGNPSVGMATTQAGALAQGLRAPIAITTIFNEYKQPIVWTTRAMAEAQQTAQRVSTIETMASGLRAGHLGTPVYMEAAARLNRVLFPLGVSEFAGFNRSQLTQSFAVDPQAAGRYFGGIGATLDMQSVAPAQVAAVAAEHFQAQKAAAKKAQKAELAAQKQAAKEARAAAKAQKAAERVAKKQAAKEARAAAQAQQQEAALTPSASGYLYTGIPWFALDSALGRLRRWAQYSLDFTAKGRSNKEAVQILSKKYPLASHLLQILSSEAADNYKSLALLQLYKQGKLNVALDQLPQRTQNLVQSQNADERALTRTLFNLYKIQAFDAALEEVEDSFDQAPITKELLKILKNRNWQDRAEGAYSDEAMVGYEEENFSGFVPPVPQANIANIENTFRPVGFVKQNASKGRVTRKQQLYYENNIPFFYRSANGQVSNSPVGILTQEKASFLGQFFYKLGLSSTRGVRVPQGFVLALDEEGHWKFVMPRGHLKLVENSAYSRRFLSDQPYFFGKLKKKKQSSRVGLDLPYTTTDLLAIANMLENNPNLLNIELKMTKPHSLNSFLRVHAWLVGNDAGQTLTGPFKDTVKAASGLLPIGLNFATNLFGGIGYATPFAAGAMMGFLSKIGHAATILGGYAIMLVALLYSWFGMGMNGFFALPANPSGGLLMRIALPPPVLVLGGSIFNTTIQTFLNFYKDPIARTTAHLTFANNKNLSRLGIALMTAVAFISGMGLNWSIVVPVATVLVLVAGGLFLNTPIWEQAVANLHKQQEHYKHRKARLGSADSGGKGAL